MEPIAFSFSQYVALAIFLLGYLAITIEHKVGTSKSAIALIMAFLLWFLVSLLGLPEMSAELAHAGADIFGIVIFLLAAMSLVEVLIHYKFFDLIRMKLFRLRLNDQKQFVLISLIAFFLSAVIDNLTTTIVMVQISRKFFHGQNLLRAAAAVVIAANAGGAFSPIGDVTTIMLWLAGKFTAYDIILQGFLPSFTLLVVAVALMYRGIVNNTPDVDDQITVQLNGSEKLIIGSVFASFALPVAMNGFNLPPYLGLLFGLGLVWVLIDVFKKVRPYPTHLEASIEELIKRTDIASLKFFVGILLAVSALHSLGILEVFSRLFYGSDPTIMRLILGNSGLGALSALVDNVPLTAIAIQALPAASPSLWVLLALTVGTGGSLFIIGSAAGVVAMGMVRELTFGTYVKIASFPALVGFITAIGVWAAQYYFFFA